MTFSGVVRFVWYPCKTESSDVPDLKFSEVMMEISNCVTFSGDDEDGGDDGSDDM